MVTHRNYHCIIINVNQINTHRCQCIYDVVGIFYLYAFEQFWHGMYSLTTVDADSEAHMKEKYGCSEIHNICETPSIISINA